MPRTKPDTTSMSTRASESIVVLTDTSAGMQQMGTCALVTNRWLVSGTLTNCLIGPTRQSFRTASRGQEVNASQQIYVPLRQSPNDCTGSQSVIGPYVRFVTQWHRGLSCVLVRAVLGPVQVVAGSSSHDASYAVVAGLGPDKHIARLGAGKLVSSLCACMLQPA